MATRRKVETTITEGAEGQRDELDPFELAVEEFGGSPSIKLQVYRYDDDGHQAYLRQVAWNPEHHDLDWVRSKWGPGTYLLRFHDRNQRNHTRSKVVTIAADTSSAPPPASSAPSPTAANDATRELLEVFRKQNELLLSAIIARKEGGGESSSSEILLKALEGNQTLNNTLLSHALSRGDTTTQIFEVFQRGLQLASELKTESEGGWLTGLRGVAKDLMPVIQEIVKQRANAPIPVESRPVPPPAALNAPRVANAPLDGPAGMPANRERQEPEAERPRTAQGAGQSEAEMAKQTIQMFLGATAPMLAAAAQRGESPQNVADELLGEIGPNYYPLLAELTANQVIDQAPMLGQHRRFVEEVLQAIQAAAREGYDDENN